MSDQQRLKEGDLRDIRRAVVRMKNTRLVRCTIDGAGRPICIVDRTLLEQLLDAVDIREIERS